MYIYVSILCNRYEILDVVIIIIIMKGLSLLRGCLEELPKERKTMIAGDMGELKRELREKVIRILVVIESMLLFKGSERE